MNAILSEYGMMAISMVVFFGLLVLIDFFVSGMYVVSQGFIYTLTGASGGPGYVSEFFTD